MTNSAINNLISRCEKENATEYHRIDAVSATNQEKVLNAFRKNAVALRHFSGSTGYGYEDSGKHVLSAVFADAFGAEAGIVSPLIASGTHAISIALFGLLRPGDMLFAASGMPYDTLIPVITGEGIGSLKEFGITFRYADLSADSAFDVPSITAALLHKPAVVLIQRSRGYVWRNSFAIAQIGEIIALIKQCSPDTIVVVDNCYGEFTEISEPVSAGADIIIGSLIKNPGGGLAPTGGYICGKKRYVELIANRLTAPGIGTEIGSYTAGYRTYFQGFFLAPHTTAQALKGALLFRSIFNKLGYEVLPKIGENVSDIVCSIRFKTRDELIRFCQTIQTCAPVDCFAVPQPWDMPGYADQVIMSAGTFVQGASIELSADAPMREPYIAYLQGGLTYEHAKIAARECVLHMFADK